MKKFAILVNSVGYGGNERSAVNIAKALTGQYDVTIITQEDCGNHYGYNGNLINLNTPCASSRVAKVLNSIRRIIKLQKLMYRERYDCILLILPITNPINYLRMKCRKIVSCRDCGDLIRHGKQYAAMTRTSNLMVCNAQMMSDRLSQDDPTLKSKIKTIYNIVDIDRINCLKEKPCDTEFTAWAAGSRVITAAGRFVHAKGWPNLIKAFSVLLKEQNVKLTLIGDGEQKELIEKLIVEMGIADHVKVMGFQENPFKYIAASDAFILSSYYEGFPNMMIEAMACGVPVIATDCPSGPAEILCTQVEEGFTIADAGVLLQYIPETESSWEATDLHPLHVSWAKAIGTVLNDSVLSSQLSSHAILRASMFTANQIAFEWKQSIG